MSLEKNEETSCILGPSTRQTARCMLWLASREYPDQRTCLAKIDQYSPKKQKTPKSIRWDLVQGSHVQMQSSGAEIVGMWKFIHASDFCR